jgi:hypothetical protein
MAEKRRKFDRDFKEGAVRLVRETDKPIAQVARDRFRGFTLISRLATPCSHPKTGPLTTPQASRHAADRHRRSP